MLISMKRNLRFRAAGAYADEVAAHLGDLSLRASVLAGLRLEDGYRFCPAKAFIPHSPHHLWSDIRKTWSEYKSLLRDLNQYFLCETGILVQPIDISNRPPRQSDHLQFALLAASLLAENVHAHCALSAALIRSGHPKAAKSVLWEFNNRGFEQSSNARSRLNRNMSAVADSLGNVDEAIHYARLAVTESPENQLARASLTEALAQREVHAQ
jgi:hypothetical protein